jgi:catabolite regulation protein CreA
MVAQINEVLQEMLPETSYSGQIIVLGEEPSTGVVIWVGAQKYIGIESVPDPEIKGLIQSAIRRWEAQSGQG